MPQWVYVLGPQVPIEQKGWMGPRANVDNFEEKKASCPARSLFILLTTLSHSPSCSPKLLL